MSTDTQKTVCAEIGDTGPRKELSEGTLALAVAILGKTSNPVNYRKVRGKSPFQAKAWHMKRQRVLYLRLGTGL
jgi:hypothetical protein